MTRYYVNNIPSDGKYKVHKHGCKWLREALSKTNLGYHAHSGSALQLARALYKGAEACEDCISHE